MKSRIAILVVALLIPCQSSAWIAFGFKSGMSRFDVSGYLHDKEIFSISEGDDYTLAADADADPRYRLSYCSTPQKLYRMKYSLMDSAESFMSTLDKYQKRYGTPEGLDKLPDSLDSDNWAAADISLIWVLSESETILLNHDPAGTSTEFQDTSVCHENGLKLSN